MKKEEILRRSRLENKNSDERDTYIREKAFNYSLLVVILLLMSVVALDYLHIIQGDVIFYGNSIPVGVFCSLFVFVGSTIECLIYYYYHHKKRYFYGAFFFGFLFLMTVAVFISRFH